MPITNRNNLPEPFVTALKRDPYSRGEANRSVTQLIDSPRVDLLKLAHDHEIERDVADNFWPLLGQAVHHILERGGDERHLPEERLFAKVNGWTVSGAIDVQVLGNGVVGISDYKVVAEYYLRNQKEDWDNQLNFYAWLVEKCKGWRVESLEIWAIVRDWSRHEARRNDYPDSPIVRVPIKLWSFADREAYVEERVRIHQEAEFLYEMDQHALPHCTDAERWTRPPKFAVWKAGNKRATRVLETEAEALAFIKGKTGYKLVPVPGEYIRCASNFCGVAKWCDQWGGV